MTKNIKPQKKRAGKAAKTTQAISESTMSSQTKALRKRAVMQKSKT